jgi:glucokinase
MPSQHGSGSGAGRAAGHAVDALHPVDVATLDPPAPSLAAVSGPVLGLDVGGTKLAAGVVDPDGRVRSFCVVPAQRDEGPQRMIERLIDLGRRALDEAATPVTTIPGVGIGCGGPLDPIRGVIQDPPNLPGWHDIPLTDLVADSFGRPAFVDNDATAAALAEWRWGAGQGMRDVVYLTISTGIGGGVIAGGVPLRGRSGNAAELGHLSVRFDGWPCPCGRRGCPEAFASGTNIARRARAALVDADVPSTLRDVPGSPGSLTARDVAEHAARGDAIATLVWDATTEVIGELVATCLDAFDPDVVILGGGVTRSGDQLLRPVVDRAQRVAMTPMRDTPVVLARLGDQLGVQAAAAVAHERLGMQEIAR